MSITSDVNILDVYYGGKTACDLRTKASKTMRFFEELYDVQQGALLNKLGVTCGRRKCSKVALNTVSTCVEWAVKIPLCMTVFTFKHLMDHVKITDTEYQNYIEQKFAQNKLIDIFDFVEEIRATENLSDKRVELIMDQLIRIIAKKCLEDDGLSLAAWVCLLKHVHPDTRDAIYKVCAKKMRSKDALLTSVMIHSIEFFGVMPFFAHRAKARLFTAYAKKDLRALSAHCAAVQDYLHDVGLKVGCIAHIIIQYSDTASQRVFIYGAQVKYLLTSKEGSARYDRLLCKLASLYLKSFGTLGITHVHELGSLASEQTRKKLMNMMTVGQQETCMLMTRQLMDPIKRIQDPVKKYAEALNVFNFYPLLHQHSQNMEQLQQMRANPDQGYEILIASLRAIDAKRQERRVS